MLGCKGYTFGCAWTSGARAGVCEHMGAALERAGVRSGTPTCAQTGVWRTGVRANGRLARGRACGPRL
ncbi:hypothetical protein CDL15_Pgr009153 [Punica granatum]|uniref:Uncharacterized protein n=1 Tax=Punica granatum TaxID=22663 RepID=A0A218WJ73_PUNGR|nr:hypothetical protein CDL15_Pgr009153 [Punica granatum]